MDALVKTRRALLKAVSAGVVALLIVAATNAPAIESAPISNQNAIVQEPAQRTTATTPSGTSPTTTPTDPGTDTGTGTDTPTTQSEASVGEEFRKDAGYGDAAAQPVADRQAEAKQDCIRSRPPISKMLAVGGVVAGDEGTSWNGLVIVIAVVSLLVAITAYLIRHHRSPTGKPAPRGALEIVSTVLAILGGIVGLAIQFVPGVGVKEEPPPEAAMTVRDVQARITKGEFAKKMQIGLGELKKIDRRQVGNVVWLEVVLQGYSEKSAQVQYAMYDPKAGGALLPGTERRVTLRIRDKDTQKSFVPIWVAYPKSEKFNAQFRLLVGDPLQVREIAETGNMRGSQFRYSC